MKRDDLTGQQFDRLTVLSFSHKNDRGELYWNCRCTCGAEKAVKAGVLRSGKARSCGCLAREINTIHGMTKTRTFKSWESMWQRCTNPNAKSFEHYGGRGIKVCDRWRDFQAFLEDMGERPEGKSLDREASDGDYTPENCRWADKYQQQRNKRDTSQIVYGGVTQSYAAWAEQTGLASETISRRIRSGWSVADALTRPSRKHKRI